MQCFPNQVGHDLGFRFCLRMLVGYYCFDQVQLIMDNEGFYETCICGRTFYLPCALTIHLRTCSKSKKRLSRALDKAKEKWMSRKRMRLEGSGRTQQMGMELHSLTPKISGSQSQQADADNVTGITETTNHNMGDSQAVNDIEVNNIHDI
jgi:hypothetical protein